MSEIPLRVHRSPLDGTVIRIGRCTQAGFLLLYNKLSKGEAHLRTQQARVVIESSMRHCHIKNIQNWKKMLYTVHISVYTCGKTERCTLHKVFPFFGFLRGPYHESDSIRIMDDQLYSEVIVPLWCSDFWLQYIRGCPKMTSSGLTK